MKLATIAAVFLVAVVMMTQSASVHKVGREKLITLLSGYKGLLADSTPQEKWPRCFEPCEPCDIGISGSRVCCRMGACIQGHTCLDLTCPRTAEEVDQELVPGMRGPIDCGFTPGCDPHPCGDVCCKREACLVMPSYPPQHVCLEEC